MRERQIYAKNPKIVFKFELFLADVHSQATPKDAEKLKLEMILQFCAGTDRVLAFGFHKNIEVYLCDISLPTVSTCNLILNFPK